MCSSLVLAAYSVAKSAGDSQYLANICKDIAQSMMTAAGQSACAAQDEVLQCCDHLYLSRKITDNQLLFLRHLVLIREEEVAEVYDDFQVHRELDRLFRDLHRIANTHPKNNEEVEENDDEYDGEDSDEEGERDPKQKVSPTFASTLSGILSLMHRGKVVTPAEAMLLHHMIRMENEFLVAAHELFLHDGDVNELQDTMVRCAKLVSRRIQEEGQKDEDDDNDEETESSDGENDSEERGQSTTQLDDILASLGVQNSWSSTVPSRFILAVFAAAQKGLLGVGQARALCDLYQAKYDLVRAAWEVYNVQGDVVDFTDTLRRIVRDLNFRDDGNVQVTSSPSTQQAQKVFDAVKESKDRTEEAYYNKQEAVEAVVEAKQELLRHSLEMMVKQEIIGGEAAQSLFDRACKGDPLTDAAIEAYASDRNIMEFLDTLQILANNTPEEINRIMRAAMEEEEEEANKGDRTDSASENTDEYDDSDFEDDDEDGNAELDSSQKKLYEIVLELVEDDMINSGTATILMTLINNRDDRVMAAYDVYAEYNDKDDLVDSLLRVARKELQQYLSARAAQEDAQEEEGIEMSSIKKEDDEASGDKYVEVEMTQMKKERGESDGGGSGDETSESQQRGLLNSGDQASILDILAKAGAIDQNDADEIIRLIGKSDPQVQKIFMEYERNKDVYHLIENLRSFSVGGSDSSGEDDQDSDEEQDDDAEDSDESRAIESRFLNIIQGMNLSHLETAALRLAIARDDFAIRSALEMFRVSRDEAELIETLRNVAKSTIDTTLTEAGYDGIEEDGGDEDASNDDDEDNDDEDVESDDDEEDDADDNQDEGDSDGDDDVDDHDQTEDNDDGGLMSTQAAREYIFPILLSELVKEKVLDEDDGDVLKKLFSNGDAVVNAALDVYDLDSDMAELVDTLQKVARAQ